MGLAYTNKLFFFHNTPYNVNVVKKCKVINNELSLPFSNSSIRKKLRTFSSQVPM